jgi:iron-sulfur cluster assembly protein
MSLDNITGPADPPQNPAPNPALGALFTITEAAAARIHDLLSRKNPAPEAVLISVTSKGCSGLSYDIQYLDRLADKPKFADEVRQHGVTVVIDPKASLYIVGSVMDYREDAMRSGFDFANPNETGRCGCGESFSVAPELAEKR